jgi:hypothetical protein
MDTTMRSFKEHLLESVKKYDFRVKIAGDVSLDTEAKLESLLGKFNCSSFKKSGKTPIQQLPLDFPKLQNFEVNIYEVTLDYPTTQYELFEYLSGSLGVARESLVVRSPGEPLEQYQEPHEKREGALLNDPDYKESPNAKFEDYYGDKYNSGFVKELNEILKLQRKARGEEIPTEGVAKFNTDTPASTESPVAKNTKTQRIK